MKFFKKLKEKREKIKAIEKYSEFEVLEKIEMKWNQINTNRISLINTAVRKVLSQQDSCKYLEIGCYDNITFDSISLRLEDKIGIDPNQGGNIRISSDEFFKNNRN